MSSSSGLTLDTIPPCLYRYMFQFMHPEDIVAIGRANKNIHERIQHAIGRNINDFARWYVETHYTNIPARFFKMNDWVYAAQSLNSMKNKQILLKKKQEDGKDACFVMKMAVIVGFSMFSILGTAVVATRSDASNTEGLEFNSDSYTWVPAGQNPAPSIGQTNWLNSIAEGGW